MKLKVFRFPKGAIATIVAYLRGNKKPDPELKSKVIKLAKELAKKKAFKKSDLGYYDDEDGYEAQLKAHQEKGGKK